jgi:hypothetical protein
VSWSLVDDDRTLDKVHRVVGLDVHLALYVVVGVLRRHAGLYASKVAGQARRLRVVLSDLRHLAVKGRGRGVRSARSVVV